VVNYRREVVAHRLHLPSERGRSLSAVTHAKQTDEVLEALDALLVALRESTQRNQVAIRRAQTIRRLRSHGRSYREILRRVEGALNLGIRVENVDEVLEANSRLQGAEVRAVHGEGMSIEEIALLSGITPDRVADLLRN
jgi:DNA-directed RNA polymerase specialized sigma24 family protein